MKDDHWKIYESEIKKRINNLLKNKFYFEIVFLFSNILEIELKNLINKHQKVCRYILNEEKIKFYPNKLFNPDEKTLGALISYIHCFIKDVNIFKELENFNEIRKKTIHKLFDQNLKTLEGEIVKFIPRFYSLIEKLLDKQISIITNLRKYKDKCKLKNIKKSEN